MDSHGDPSSAVIGRVLQLLESEFRELRREKASLENVKAAVCARPFTPLQKVKLDVGGRIFATTLHTLTQIPDCYFGTTFSEQWYHHLDQDGAFFIDRDPTAFPHILNYLRDYPDSAIDVDLLTPYELHMLRKEALFYNLQPLVELLATKQAKTGAPPLPLGKKKPSLFEDDGDDANGENLFGLFGDD